MIIVYTIIIGSMNYLANGELLSSNIRPESRKTSDSINQSLLVVTDTAFPDPIYVFDCLQTYFEIDFGGDIHDQ